MEPTKRPLRRQINFKLIFQILGLPILGSIITIFIGRIYSKQDLRYEESVKINSEYIQSNFAILNTVNEWSELSMEITSINRRVIYIKNEDKEGLTDTIGYPIVLPSIAISKTKKAAWDSLHNLISEGKKNIDIDLYKSCYQINLFIQENPFPKDMEFETIENSGWNDSFIKARWQTLIEILKAKINRRLSLIKEYNELEL
jgi:hypothetical protein